MTEPRGRRFDVGRWGWVTFQLVLVVAGSGLVAGIWAYTEGTMPAFLWATVIYTVYAVLTTAVYAVCLVVRGRPRAVRTTTVEGQEARGISVWTGHLREELALDLGLGVLAVALAWLAAGEGGILWVLVPLLAAIAARYLGRLVLAATGRRRTEALWLTDTHVVHDSVAGRVRVPRDRVVDVRPVTRSVFVEHDGGAEQTISPRPWRPRRRLDPRLLIVEIADMGMEVGELASWLRSELDLDRSQAVPPETLGRRVSRWWQGS